MARVVARSTRMRTRLGPGSFGEQGRWSLLGRGMRSEVNKELSRGTFLFTPKFPIRLPVSSLSTFDLINVRYLQVYPTQSPGTRRA